MAEGRGRKRRVVLFAALLLAVGIRCAVHKWVLYPEYDHTRFLVAGTPEEVGRAVGRQYGGTIKQMHPVFLSLCSVLTHQKKAALYAKAAEIAAHIDAVDIAEIKGVAEGSGMEYEDVLFLNLFYTLASDTGYCRQLAAWGGATADGGLIHARNLDWPDYPGSPLRKHNIVLNVRPRRGIEYMLLTWPGFQCALTGTNKKGITVAFNMLNVWGDRGRLAEPIFFTLKRVLRTCGTLEEAVALVRKARPLGSGSVLLSDAVQKKAVVLEVINGAVDLREPSGDLIGNGNTRASMLKAAGRSVDSPAGDVAREMGGALDVKKITRVMADRRVLQSINILSVVFVPAKNRMYLSCGRYYAAKGEFKEYPLFREDF